jgi:glycosyltransferase involved in cell wall biosynthesis
MTSNEVIDCILTVITPVTKLSGELDKLQSWLPLILDKKIEVWVVHDIADEETGNELRNILSSLHNPHVHLIEETVGGPGPARNLGLEKTQSEWVCFWDADDLPDVEEMLLMIGESNLHDEVLIGNFQILDLVRELTLPVTFNRDVMYAIGLNPGLWRMVFRTSSVNGIRFKKIKMGEDQLFLAEYRLASRAKHLHEGIVYQYTLGRPGQLTKNQSSIDEIISSVEKLSAISKDMRGEDLRFVSLLLARQVLTGVKRGSFHIKMKILKFLFINMVLRHPRLGFQVVRTAIKISLGSLKGFSNE